MKDAKQLNEHQGTLGSMYLSLAFVLLQEMMKQPGKVGHPRNLGVDGTLPR